GSYVATPNNGTLRTGTASARGYRDVDNHGATGGNWVFTDLHASWWSQTLVGPSPGMPEIMDTMFDTIDRVHVNNSIPELTSNPPWTDANKGSSCVESID